MDALENSPTQWKILGNQVMFADYNVGWAAMASNDTAYWEVIDC